MEQLNLSKLNGETISIFTKSLKKQHKYWFDDTKKFFTDGKFVLPNNVIINLDIKNIQHVMKFYCICEYKGELYKTFFGRQIYDMVMKINPMNPQTFQHVLDIKINIGMKEIFGGRQVLNYEKTVVSHSQLPLKYFIEIYGNHKEEIDFYLKNGYLTHIPKWYEDNDFMDNLIEKGIDVYDIISKVREGRIDEILNIKE